MTPWILVENEKPPPNTFILVTTIGGSLGILSYDRGTWHETTGGTYKGAAPTHWTRLPNRPEAFVTPNTVTVGEVGEAILVVLQDFHEEVASDNATLGYDTLADRVTTRTGKDNVAFDLSFDKAIDHLCKEGRVHHETTGGFRLSRYGGSPTVENAIVVELQRWEGDMVSTDTLMSDVFKRTCCNELAFKTTLDKLAKERAVEKVEVGCPRESHHKLLRTKTEGEVKAIILDAVKAGTEHVAYASFEFLTKYIEERGVHMQEVAYKLLDKLIKSGAVEHPSHNHGYAIADPSPEAAILDYLRGQATPWKRYDIIQHVTNTINVSRKEVDDALNKLTEAGNLTHTSCDDTYYSRQILDKAAARIDPHRISPETIRKEAFAVLSSSNHDVMGTLVSAVVSKLEKLVFDTENPKRCSIPDVEAELKAMTEEGVIHSSKEKSRWEKKELPEMPPDALHEAIRDAVRSDGETKYSEQLCEDVLKTLTKRHGDNGPTAKQVEDKWGDMKKAGNLYSVRGSWMVRDHLSDIPEPWQAAVRKIHPDDLFVITENPTGHPVRVKRLAPDAPASELADSLRICMGFQPRCVTGLYLRMLLLSTAEGLGAPTPGFHTLYDLQKP
jgi:hypothetical protein